MMLKPRQRHLLAQLQGGLLIWKEMPWWVCLPSEIRSQAPHLLARWALDGGDDHPRTVASWLGSQEVHLMDEAAQKRWKGQLAGAGLSPDLLPPFQKILAMAAQPPKFGSERHHALIETAWPRLGPLLGRKRAEAALSFLCLADLPQSEREEAELQSYRRLKELFHQDRELRSDWYHWSDAERVDLFERWMGARPERRASMEYAVSGTAWSEGLDRIRKAWLPTVLDPAHYLAVGLCRPGVRAPQSLTSSDAMDMFRTHQAYRHALSSERFQAMLDVVAKTGLSGYLLAHTKLAPEALDFVKEHKLGEALEGRESWGREERQFVRLCRALISAGLDSRWLNHATLKARSGRPEAFVYLLLLDLEQPPSAAQAEVIDQIAPGAKLSQQLSQRAEFPPELRADWAALVRGFDLPPKALEQCVTLRLTLGLPPFPKKLQSWAPSRVESEKRHLQVALTANPEDEGLSKRVEALKSRYPDEKEIKRVREEFERATPELSLRHWNDIKPRVLQRLLASLVGAEVAQQAPRLGLLLRQSELSVAQLAGLRRDHPENDAWLRRFEAAGFSAAHWLDDWSADFQVDGRHVDLVAETDPAQSLEMGSHFQTCLSLDDGFNAFSVLTNILEVNKKVLIGRDVEGNVVLRKLIGLTLKGELVGYHTYSHWPKARPLVHRACAEYARRHGYSLSDTATPESVITGLAWYNDGAEPWEVEEAPHDLPSDWPRDPLALRQWRLATKVREDGWSPVRPVEFARYLLDGGHGAKISETRSWRLSEAAELLATAGRFDRLSDPRLPLEPSDRIEALDSLVGFESRDLEGYAALLDPDHRAYRAHPRSEVFSDLEDHRLRPVLALLPPGELRRLLEKLVRTVPNDGWSELFLSLPDILGWAYHLQPNDAAWRHYDSDLMGSFMLEVATRQAMPCWRDALVSWTKSRPEWESRCWYARALFEGPKIGQSVLERLAERRDDLQLALAAALCGEDPSDYRLPDGEELFDPDFLVAARPLRSMVERRLQRMESRGLHLEKMKFARARLTEHRTEEWLRWPKSYRDRTLDRALTPKVLQGRDPDTRAAWVSLAASGDRVHRLTLLRALKLEIPTEHAKALADRVEFMGRSLTDQLLRLDLGGALETGSVWEDGTFHLALTRWPEILDPALKAVNVPDRLSFLAPGAEILEPEALRSRLREYLGRSALPSTLVSAYLGSEYDSVVLQQELLTHRISGDLREMKSERGQWALGLLASKC